MFCPCCLGSAGKQSPCKQLDQFRSKPVCLCEKLWSHFSAKLPHSNFQTIRRWKRSEKKTGLTCHYWFLAAVHYPIVTNNLFNFASNVFLAPFKHNDWGVKFSSQLCKYGIILWAAWCYFAFGSWSLPPGACDLKYPGRVLGHSMLCVPSWYAKHKRSRWRTPVKSMQFNYGPVVLWLRTLQDTSL